MIAALRIERVLVTTKVQFARTDNCQPHEGNRIEWTECERVSYVTFGLLGMTVVKLGETNDAWADAS